MSVTIDERGTLASNTKYGYIAICFDVTTQRDDEPEAKYKAIRINNLTLIELQSDIWCLTDFDYTRQYFKCVGEYKELVTCFVEIPSQKDYEAKVDKLANTNLGIILDLAIDNVEQLDHKSYTGKLRNTIYKESVQFQILFNGIAHRVENFDTTYICLFRNHEAYTNQIDKWNKEEEEKRRGARELMNLMLSDLTKADWEKMNEEDKQRILKIMGNEWLEGILNKQ